MSKLGRRKIIQVKLEAAKGTPLDGDTHVMVYDPQINPEDTFQQRQPSGKSAGNAVGVVGEHKGRCTFRAELRSDGINALDAGLEILLQACGTKLTVAAGPPVVNTYAPASAVADQKTITIDVYEDGLKKRIYGAMGEVKISGEFGKQVFLEFDFQGIWAAPTDEALPSPSISARLPLRMASATLTIGAYTPKISNFSLDLNANVVQREDVSQASALAHFLIAGRDPQVGMDMEADAVAAHDAYGLWLAGTEAALSLVLSDGTVDVTIAAPKLQYRQITEGGEDLLRHELTGQLNVDSADDEVTIEAKATV